MTRRSVAVKAIAALASVAMLSSLAACGDKKATTGEDGKPLVKVLVVKNTNQDKMENMQWAKDLEKEAGVDIEWQEVTDDSWGQQKNPALSGGDIPDVLIRAITPTDAASFPNLFEDLSKNLDKLPNVKKFFEQKPDAQKLTTDPEGHMYVLASSRGKSYSGSGQNMMINKAWLDKLGLDMPTTWDEFENVLKAFKTKDPNGNGKADEIPMNIRKLDTGGFGWYSPMLMLNSTGIATGFNKGPSGQGYYAKDGKVGSYLVSDEYKSVIKYYNKLISEGLIPNDWSTKDDDTYYAEQTGKDGTALTGVIFGWSLADFSDLRDQYVAMPVPSATGVSAEDTVWDGSSNEYEVNKLAISATATNKDAAYKVANLLYSQKYSVQQFGGSIGDTVTDDGNDHYTFDTDKIDQLTKDNKFPGLSDRLAGWISDDTVIEGDDNAEDILEVNKVFEEQRSHYDHTKDYIPDYVQLTAEKSTEVANNNTQILNVAIQKAGEWMSNGGIDNDWDAYCKQLDQLGLQQNIKDYQEAYDEYVK